MSASPSIFIGGFGAVSPAGWGVPALRDAINKGIPLPCREIPTPGRKEARRIRSVPLPVPKPAFLANPRLRRSSSITQYSVAAAIEALDGKADPALHGRIGVIVCVLSGCVGYSRRFYEETLKDPATASPLVFPETVFNAPASHLSAFLGSTAINYTLVGDAGTFLVGLATAAGWLCEDKVDSVLVIGSEEMDWLTSDALELFDPGVCFAEGSGALLLSRKPSALRLRAITDEYLFTAGGSELAVTRMRDELLQHASAGLLVESSSHKTISGLATSLWSSWDGPQLAPKSILGEGLVSSTAINCVVAADWLHQNHGKCAAISVAGTHQHAVGAVFTR